MKKFSLTLEKPECAPSDWDQFLYSTMRLLMTRFDLHADEPDLCNTLLSDFLTEKELRDLTIFVNGRDWQSQVKFMGELRLIGNQAGKSDNFCPRCGSPEWFYNTGVMTCNKCEHHEYINDEMYDDGDINDFSGRIDLGNKLY